MWAVEPGHELDLVVEGICKEIRNKIYRCTLDFLTDGYLLSCYKCYQLYLIDSFRSFVIITRNIPFHVSAGGNVVDWR